MFLNRWAIKGFLLLGSKNEGEKSEELIVAENFGFLAVESEIFSSKFDHIT